MPGHKGGGGPYRALAGLVGRKLLRLDLTELPGLDDPHHPVPGGAIREAEALAAEVFGSRRARFLAGGSTAGVLAMILAAAGPGDTLLAPQPFHRSVVAGAILAGCRLEALSPRIPPAGGVPAPAGVGEIEEALRRRKPAALLVTSPTYEGLSVDLGAVAQACARARVPLLVDAAHGAHFGFSPLLPPPAAAAGPSACVVSLHKTAGALTPGSLLLTGRRPGAFSDGPPSTNSPERVTARPPALDEARLEAALRLVQTSSPPFPLLASLDLARRSLALRGRADWTKAARRAEAAGLDLARRAAGRLETLSAPPGLERDITRLVLCLTPKAARDVTGPDLLAAAARAGIDLELAGWGHVVAVVTPADSARSLRELTAAFPVSLLEEGTPVTDSSSSRKTASRGRRELALTLEKNSWEAPPDYALPPSEAFHQPRRRVPLPEAEGRVAADVICPYPPGVPLVIPGQRIGPELIDYLAWLDRAGRPTQGLDKGTSIEVIAE